ncbi:MAG: TaqI-like C-terminal specificity domain-containing protein [Planctomycetota bacterium]
MDKKQAQTLIKETFELSFDKNRFVGFVKNLLNEVEEATFIYKGNYIPDAYEQYINTLERIGKYSDGEHKIDILIAKLKKETSIERARTMQRNFVAWYLNGSRGGELKDAALVAFVAPNEEDWRFSLVKMDYRFEEGKKGRMRVKEEFTPARRWSFLVGANENSHTAQSQLVDRVADDENKPTLTQLEEAFNIEKVTKEFFEKYKELFLWTKETLDNVVKKDKKIKADFETKGVNTVDFSKKLLGQIVFLYFLQKKGWFGVKRDAEWGTGPKNFLRELLEGKHGTYKNFFNDILEPLFYEALARERDDNFYSRFNCKIPFLNGGLFDPIKNYDWVHTDIFLPNELFSNDYKTKEGDIGSGILDVFDRYNFTVKEDEPLEKEVAIDPELLGKAYEKFNAIRPDNYEEYEKALKSGENGAENKFNKQYGVYYTPREIVHYMCQQSLINYLTAELDGKVIKEDVELLIKYGEQVSENEATVEAKGRETDTYFYKLPESIRQNAKLLDEALSNIKVCDPAIGSGAFPVGMMSELVKIRNVLSTYIKKAGRTLYGIKRECIEKSLYGVDIDAGAVEIAKLRLWLSLVVDEDDIKQIKPLPNLDYKIVCGNSLLGVEKDLFNSHLFAELERLKPLLFNETNPSKKQQYKKQIDDLINKITNGHKEFDFEVYFSEVFHEKKGFDVVIANPPYVQIKQIPWNERKIYEKKFKSAVGRFNLFYFFLEITSKIVKPNGLSTFIVPDRLLLNTQCDELRKWLLQEQTILGIASFAEGVFQAVVDNIIIIYRNVRSCGENVKAKNRVTIDTLERVTASEIPITYFLDSPNSQFDLSYNPSISNLINKITAKSTSLGEISEIKDGIIQGKIADKLFLDKQINNDSKPLLFGEDVTRYSIKFNNKWVNYRPDEMMRIEVKRRGPGIRHGLWMRVPEIFERAKILTRQTADEIVAAYDTKCFYYSNTLHGTTITDKEYDPLYVLALMNSKLMTWYYRSTTAEEGKVFAQIKIEILRKLPIIKVSKPDQQSFVAIVERILSVTQNKDYLENPAKQKKIKEYERQIDQMVYELYGLNKEEIKIVENTASGGKKKIEEEE